MMEFSMCLLSSFLLLLNVDAVLIENHIDPSLGNTTFDYIVIGCGIAGLVVANRLTEDPNTTVICLEAGNLDKDENDIRIPYYIGLQPYLFYEWGHDTTPQAQLDNKTRGVPMGKGVGGGSLINGLIWNRGAAADFDIWERLGNVDWSWADLLPYFRKSETFTPQAYPGEHLNDPSDLDSFNVSVHGFTGPAQVSYPNYLWPQTSLWFEGLEELGVPKALDPNDGTNGGGYFVPLSIDPSDQTRSDARRSYYDPVAGRPNLSLGIHAQVTRILFDEVDNHPLPESSTPYAHSSIPTKSRHRRRSPDVPLHATAVLFASNSTAPIQTVYARREVVLAAGSIHSSRLLELSGIGHPSLLRLLNIPTLHPLEGVGANLQDHALIHLNYAYKNPNLTSVTTFSTNATFYNDSKAEYYSSRTGPWTAKPSTAIAFPSLPQTTNSPYTSRLTALASTYNATQNLPPLMSTSYTLTLAHADHINLILTSLLSPHNPAHEILNSNAGSLDLSLMRPLSRGEAHITSSNPWLSSAINPNWLAHPLDLQIMLRALEFNQKLLCTPALAQLEPSFDQVPFDPSIAQMTQILKTGVGTEYHYAGTTAMLPESAGGVVSPELIVYGTDNLRVVDSGIFPIIPGAHLQAVVYAVAEKAADLIKGGNQEVRVTMLRESLGKEVPMAQGWWEWLREVLTGGGGRKTTWTE